MDFSVFLRRLIMPDESQDREPELDFDSISRLIPPSKEGDQDARQQLLSQIQDYVNLMAARHMDQSLRTKAGPSDIVQQSLTQVVQNFDQFRGGTAAEFRGWLKTIVVNEMGKMRRDYHAMKRNVAREVPLSEQPHGAESAKYNLNSPTDPNPTPSSEAMVAEQIENFYQIMDRLPEDYAEVIRLRSIERMSFNEVAEKMDRTHNSVTKLWYRAILKFEELLKKSDNFTSGL